MSAQSVDYSKNETAVEPSGINEAIILAGGLGTRLRDAVPGLPKCLAPVAGRAFLFHLVNYLRSQGISKFIFSLGFKHDIIEAYINQQFPSLDSQFSVEQTALDTGGAIQLACSKVSGSNVVIANGDTLFRADLSKAAQFQVAKAAACTVLLKPMTDFERYGAVEITDEGRIANFAEKKYQEDGLINGGTYILNIKTFLSKGFPEKFSFEKDFLEKSYRQDAIYGIEDDGYFIDIGIPEDFERANKELAKTALDLAAIDKTWTLFIDRDGVLNRDNRFGYILNWNEFIFYDGAKEALAKLSQRFGKIILVSNQRGVSRQLMTEEDLLDIHQRMQAEIEAAGGRLDRIYYSTANDNHDPGRKPNPGMAFLAKKDFPEIDLSKALMIGNKPTDMSFGRNAGLYCIFLTTTDPETPFPNPDIDLRYHSLAEFANSL